MDILSQVVQLLDRYRLETIDVLGNEDSTSRFTDFYRQVKDGKIKTDEEAAIYMYGAKALPTDSKYRFFKSQFKDRLLNTVYFIDTDSPQFSDFQKVYYASLHEWGAINLLYRKGLFLPPNDLAERLLTTCIKYELTELCVLILDKLKNTYGRIIGDKKRYDEVKIMFWHYKEVWEAETIAEELFTDISIEYVKSTAFRPETSLIAQESLDKLEDLKLKHNSFLFCHSYYCIKEAIYSAKNDWENVLIVCDEALTLFDSKPFNMKTFIGIFLNQKVIALLMLKRYNECKKTLDATLNLQEEGSFNWFKTMEKKMLLCFHTENFTEGYHTFKQVVAVKEFKNLQGHSAEIWKLFEANLYLALSLGKLPQIEKNKKDAFGKFKLNKFLNEIPTFANDKKGMNIPVLTIQIALMVSEKMYDSLIDRLETMEKYLVRHVAKSDIAGYRSNQFIKALLEIPKSGFSRVALARRTEKIMKDLSEVPFSLVSAGYKIEVMQYEYLWEEILKLFGTKNIVVKRTAILREA